MKNRELVFEEMMKSKKYKDVNKDLVIKIVDEELPKYKNNNLCIKSVKNKLHQIHGAFIKENSNKKTKELLKEKMYDDILKLHTSTLERFSFYGEFYRKIFFVTGVPNSIMDIACGYNPFAIKYMNLPDKFKYFAYDINEETNTLLNFFFKTENYNAVSKTIDLSMNIPSDKCDIALVLKFLALMTQQNKEQTQKLLKGLNANYIVVSFPTRTLTGLNKGMQKNYTNSFKELIKKDFIILDELVFENEVVFIIRKND